MAAGRLDRTKARICCQPAAVGPTRNEEGAAYPPDQAALLCVSLTPSSVGQWQALYNGKRVGVTRAIPFATTFIGLNCRMEMWVRGPFDYLHYYVSQGPLERIAVDNGVSTSFRLQEPSLLKIWLWRK